MLLAVAVLAAPAAAAAEDTAPVLRGTVGLVEVPFAAANRGPGEMVCSAALAHWYSLDLGLAAPGGRVEASLWYDPKDGTMALLNGSKDRMPVQALWCGIAGRTWATRSVIGLERRAGGAPAPIRLTCGVEADRIACR